MTGNVLRLLEDEGYFVEQVGNHFRNTKDYGNLLSCEVKVDDDRLRWAHGAYLQGVSEFSIRLASGDPDHYKRCGVLLQALYRIKPIVAIEFNPELDEVDTLSTPLGVNHSDAEETLSMGRTFQIYHNELTSFSYAYNVCAMYETDPVKIDSKYIHNMCVYLESNDNLSAESLYMVFMSLMAR